MKIDCTIKLFLCIIISPFKFWPTFNTQLILNKRGTSISVKEGRYFVKNKEQESYVPFQQVRSIMLHSATNLSHEVISVAIQHNTEILFIDRKGFPIGRVWSHHFGSISTIRKNQLAFAQSTAGIDWIKDILVKKGNNQILVLDLLGIILQKDIDVADAKSKIKASTDKIKNYAIQDHSETFASFRGYEGSMTFRL